MQGRAPLLLAVLVGLAVWPTPTPPAAASCEGPHLDVGEGAELSRTRTVSVVGDAFVDGCRDTMSCTEVLGCSRCHYNDPPPVPLQDVRLRLVQDGQTWPLAVADADTADEGDAGRVRWRFTLPAGVEPGRARLVADHVESAVVVVVR